MKPHGLRTGQIGIVVECWGVGIKYRAATALASVAMKAEPRSKMTDLRKARKDREVSAKQIISRRFRRRGIRSGG